ncbi:xanthine dehydrogenase family protein molybdopterin-binding subunit [Larkinella punicea]|uniref:Xanthine dehydrogenase family protein molybdopterin-binding subunit n=1 Tax=Larkinella punicea TaxID=2315727 RepID=A0A368JGX6_9BACT|nr:molybdopterin cofactor-binding domain-containing protein [Larkinella punicea]RCR66907.1 xanthine dehydrogenase family protein molybdopterin-binding subunit [Larkinella punicea]
MKETADSITQSRRNFLKTAGCLTIGFSFSCQPLSASEKPPWQDSLPGSLRQQPQINAWLEVLDDGRIRIFTGKLELGQGIRTAIAQVAAEELDMDLNKVEVHLAETGRTPHEGYTAGSGSIENSAMAVRYAAAAARQKLLELAANRWDKPADQLNVANGKVQQKTGAEQFTFAQLLNGKQLEDDVRLPVALKPKSDYRWVGKPIPRTDIERMARGEPVYVQDLRFPGMVHARVVRPLAQGAKLRSFDVAALKKTVPGVLKTVINGNFLGILATEEYEAVQSQLFAREQARWETAKPLPDEKKLAEYIKKIPAKTRTVKESGDLKTIQQQEGSLLKASYFKPYHMHGSIGPSCAVALYQENKLHIWTHSQGVYPLREALKEMLGLETDAIHVVGVPGSGCYGHNGADDVAADAALLAMAYPGKHVRLQWSRDDEHGWEPYGSAMRMEAEARLDRSGKITHWRYDLWTDSHSTRPGGEPGNLLVARSIEKPFSAPSGGYSGGGYRNSEPYYTIPNLKVDAHFFEGPLRVSALRSLGAYANVFAIESFMDELAEKAGKDPLEFRLAHLDDERAMAVVKKLQELTRSEKMAANEGIGFAFSRYKNVATYCAVAARVFVDTKTCTVQVRKMWSVIDAGEVINPDGLKNQTEGGMIQSASWTLKEQVTFGREHVSSRDWRSYPIFRFSDIPEVEVVIIDRPTEKPLGAGEAAQGPTAAALTNAIYRACGKRIRDLPINLEVRGETRE